MHVYFEYKFVKHIKIFLFVQLNAFELFLA